MSSYRFIIAGGKTGGHLFPGIAIADILKRKGDLISFVGSAGGLEEKILPEKKYSLDIIKVGGLKGKNIFSTIKNLLLLPVAFIQSLKIIKKRQADAVICLGGFAAGPVALAAKFKGK